MEYLKKGGNYQDILLCCNSYYYYDAVYRIRKRKADKNRWVCILLSHNFFLFFVSFVLKLGFRQRRNGATKSHQQIVRLAQTTGIENTTAGAVSGTLSNPRISFLKALHKIQLTSNNITTTTKKERKKKKTLKQTHRVKTLRRSARSSSC